MGESDGSLPTLFDIGRKYDPLAVIRTRDQLKTHVWRAFDELAQKLGPRSAARIRNHEREALAELERRHDAFSRPTLAETGIDKHLAATRG
jgi:hypothetical protein